ncbi:MAG: RHS repeat domain-containing protein [Cytophagaceae bacterium]
MKAGLVPVLLLILVSSSLNAQELEGPPLDSLVGVRWDPKTDTFEKMNKYSYTYDNKDRQTSSKNENWYQGELSICSRNIYTYDSTDKMVSKEYQKLKDGDWIGEELETYTYDPMGRLLIRLSDKDSKQTYTYNKQGKQSSEMDQAWEDDKWKNILYTTWAYDLNGKMIKEVKKGIYDEQNLFTYDAKGILIKKTYLKWNGKDWNNNSCNDYTYDLQGNIIKDSYSNWAGGKWQNTEQTTYTYDGKKNMLSQLQQEKKDGSGWANISRLTFAYDANNHVTSTLREDWKNGSWVNYKKELFTYDKEETLLYYSEIMWLQDSWKKTDEHKYKAYYHIRK